MILMKPSRKNGLFDFLTEKQVTYHGKILRKQGPTRVSSYLGKVIYRFPDGDYTTSIDKDSHHDTLPDAKRFIKSWVRDRQNGKPVKVAELVPGLESLSGSFLKAGKAWSQAGSNIVQGVTGGIKKLRPNPVDLASLRYQEFTGFAPDQIIEVESKTHVHPKTYALGILVCLVVMDVNRPTFRFIQGPGVHYVGNLAEAAPSFVGTPKGYWEFNEKTPSKEIAWLTGSVGTRLGKQMIVQLFVQGGDQHLDTRALGLTERDHHDNMLVGTLYRVWYRARKKFEDSGKQMFDFYHDFGSVAEGAGGICPVVTYHPLDPSIHIVGGRYQIAMPEKELGGMSPGIIG